MRRKNGLTRMGPLGLGVLLTALSCLLFAGAAAAQFNGPDSQDRAAWLLERGSLADISIMGTTFQQSEIGGSGGAADVLNQEEKYASSGKGPSAGLTILASAILPGAGEALMGYKRGYVMMVLDIFSWTQVAKYHGDGKDFTDEYYAYADAHYSDEFLVEGYNGASTDPERSGEGAQYFPGVTENITSVDDLHHLPLYVSVEDDRREYYENLGKWDQFIFGWDDYLRPSFWGPTYGYEATGDRNSDLQQPWVSEHREVYRTMRDDANDAYKKRDRYMYFNMGLRVFSVMQVAYFNGLLGGDDDKIEVAGHQVEIITEPRGLNRGTLAARVSF